MAGESCTFDLSPTATGVASCGTGGWTGPQPGDPNTANVLITATPAFGGIDVNWTYPDLNPNAVAYTEIWRSLLPASDSAIRIAYANGSFYYDRINDESKPLYYYWVVVVSIYGTRSEMIGPAWSRPKPLIESMIEELTGQIDAGVLAQSLKGEIDQIQMNKLGITQEMLDRDANDTALGVRITEIGAYTGDTRALLQQEVLARTSANEAFVGTVNTLYTELNGNVTAVQESLTALQNDFGTLAQSLTNLETSIGDDMAQLQQTLQTKIDTVDGKVVSIGALWTAQLTVNGLVGGFGVYNDGQMVEAGFDVDRFWIGRTNSNKRKPFIIDSGVVYIDDAAINKLTFSKLRDESGSFIVENGKIKANYIQVGTLVVNNAQSLNYVAGSTGWAFKADGTAEINGNVAGTGRITITNNLIRVFDASGLMRVRMGMW
jgi:hypothetical protein